MKKEKEVRILSEGQVEGFLATVTPSQLLTLVEPLRRNVDQLLSLLESQTITSQLLPGVSFMVMATSTIQAVFESLRIQLGKENFNKVIKEAGFEAGAAFGNSLTRFLMNQNTLPRNIETLVRIWAPFDRAANWGHFEVSKVSLQKLVVALLDNFLERESIGEKHRFCPFIEGYVEGFLWEAFKNYYCWYSEALSMPEAAPVEPVAVQETPRENVCIFEVDFKREELEIAFQQYYRAKQANWRGETGEVAIALRGALEMGFKVKVGLEKESPASFYALIKGYKANSVPELTTVLSVAQEVYELTSRAVHATKWLEPPELEPIIFKVSRVLRQLELTSIGKERAQAIVSSLGKR